MDTPSAGSNRETPSERSWKQVCTVTIRPAPVEMGSINDQVAQAITNLPLPEFPEHIWEQVEAAVVRAVLDVAENARAAGTQAQGSGEVQVCFKLEGPVLRPGVAAPASTRWGLFHVQKRPSSPAAPKLFVDVYLYQE